jgi:AraC-like DNA-binding protein
LVSDLGGPLDEILESAGLSREQIEEPSLLIPFDRQIRLLQVAARRCHCEEFALELAARQNVAIFGALSLLVMQASTVLGGLNLFGRYLHYSVQAVRLDLRVDGQVAHFSVDSHYQPALESDQFWDHAMALACSVLRLLCGDAWSPRAVYLRRPEPPVAEGYSRYFRAPVAFGSEVGSLVFSSETLDRSISRSLSTMPEQLQDYLRTTYEGDFLEQVRRVINSLLPTHDCSATTVAQCLGYSLRSLQRKLRSEETSFQRQLDRVRSELAINYLQEPQFSLTDIGQLLGFSEQAVFTRSFKRWFGVTPSQWRSRSFA